MSFHQCIECQNLFRADERKCPNCGKPVVPSSRRERLVITALLSMVVVLGVVGYQLAASQRSDLKPPYTLSEAGSISVLPPNEDFASPIHPLEEHYSRLLALLKDGQYDGAADTLSIMKDLNGLDYRDTSLLAKKVVIHGLEEEAKRIPARKVEDNIVAYRNLLAMDPGNGFYEHKIAHYEARRRELQMQDQERQKGTKNGKASAVLVGGAPPMEAPF